MTICSARILWYRSFVIVETPRIFFSCDGRGPAQTGPLCALAFAV